MGKRLQHFLQLFYKQKAAAGIWRTRRFAQASRRGDI